MRRLRLILGIGMLATVLTVGVVACGDDEDDNGGSTTPVATEPADGDATVEPTEPADDGDGTDDEPAE
jgi:hypothetical protein